MDRKKVYFGLFLVVVGLLLLGRSFNFFYFTFGDLFRFLLPLAFILLGAWLIIRKKSQEDRLQAHVKARYSSTSVSPSVSPEQRDSGAQATGFSGTGSQAPPTGAEPIQQPGTGTGAGTVKFSKFLGDLFIDCANVNLQNVEISIGVGDTEVKLHGGRLASGLNRMIISGFVGDIRVFIPNDMPYYIHCSNFVGDIDAGGQHSSGFSNRIESQSADYDTAESKLYIAASNFLGDIKLFVV